MKNHHLQCYLCPTHESIHRLLYLTNLLRANDYRLLCLLLPLHENTCHLLRYLALPRVNNCRLLYSFLLLREKRSLLLELICPLRESIRCLLRNPFPLHVLLLHPQKPDCCLPHITLHDLTMPYRNIPHLPCPTLTHLAQTHLACFRYLL